MREYADKEQALLDELAALPEELEPARDLWPGIAARIASPAAPASPRLRRPRVRWVLFQSAAALAFFAAGALAGHILSGLSEEAQPVLRRPLHGVAGFEQQGENRPTAFEAGEKKATPEPALRQAEPAIDLGMELDCGDCGWFAGQGGRQVWRASTFPKVRTVEPGGPAARAGIRPGDVLLEIDGYSFIERAAGEHLGGLRAGQRITLRIGRVGVFRNVTVVPRAKGNRL